MSLFSQPQIVHFIQVPQMCEPIPGIILNVNHVTNIDCYQITAQMAIDNETLKDKVDQWHCIVHVTASSLPTVGFFGKTKDECLAKIGLGRNSSLSIK